jgi:glycerate 2-kinase
VSDRNKMFAQDLKQTARDIFDHALAQCSIERAFDRSVKSIVDSQGLHLVFDDAITIPLGQIKHLRIVAVGKAATPMLASLLLKLPRQSFCDMQGVLIAPVPPPTLPNGIRFFAGGHPLPNGASFAGASAAIMLLKNVGNLPPEETLCIFLISGGTSSMMELPLDSTITDADTAAFHQTLIHSGAAIVEMNCVRKHFSAVKGGRLALAAGKAHKVTLLVSDVPSSNLDALGSGPTTPDPTTVEDCRDVLERYDLFNLFPISVRRFFQSSNLPETPKPGQLTSPIFKLIDSDDLAYIARLRAVQLGFHTFVDNTCDDWRYDSAADYLLGRFRQLRSEYGRVCLISTGEVSVPLPSAYGRIPCDSALAGTETAIGGRNQHFALYVATQLSQEDSPIAVLSAGTDGIDGNSKAAGAIVDSATLTGEYPVPSAANPKGLAVMRRISASQALEAFNSSSWLGGIGATLVTGPTGTNLRDLRIFVSG